jgi:hypothetical protein
MRAHECTATIVIVKMARLLDFGPSRACDASVNRTGSQCTLVPREVRLYPAEGQALTAYGADILHADGGLIVELESAGAERIVENFVPMRWPEYRHVTDLPFSELLYATLR